MVSVHEVRSERDIREFLRFPLRLYRECPYYAPALYGDEKKLLRNGGGNEDAESAFFLAEQDGKTVGRIQALIQKQENLKQGTSRMRFTRFDAVDDADVSDALFAAAEAWGATRGMKEICGPLGYSDLDREGLLVEGFEEYSTFEEQYSYPYYPALVEHYGFVKDADWVEFELRKPQQKNEMLDRVAQRAMEINHLHIAPTDLPKRAYIEKYRDGFFECLEVCYRNLYGTVPLSREEQDELISQFMLIVNKKFLIFLCDASDRVVGFGLCFPGIGKALRPSGGRLTPAALLRVLHAVSCPKTVDLGLVAVLPEYQRSGVNAVMIQGLMTLLEAGETEKCETNLNLETNEAVLSQWKYFDARQHKRRRCYLKQIGES